MVAAGIRGRAAGRPGRDRLLFLTSRIVLERALITTINARIPPVHR